jgi:hypothetical protein
MELLESFRPDYSPLFEFLSMLSPADPMTPSSFNNNTPDNTPHTQHTPHTPHTPQNTTNHISNSISSGRLIVVPRLGITTTHGPMPSSSSSLSRTDHNNSTLEDSSSTSSLSFIAAFQPSSVALDEFIPHGVTANNQQQSGASLGLQMLMSIAARSIGNNQVPMNFDEWVSETLGTVQVGVRDISRVTDIVKSCECEEASEGTICAICQDSLVRENDPNTLLRRIKKCKHIYCASCIESWLSRNKKCPVCQQYVDED